MSYKIWIWKEDLTENISYVFAKLLPKSRNSLINPDRKLWVKDENTNALFSFLNTAITDKMHFCYALIA